MIILNSLKKAKLLILITLVSFVVSPQFLKAQSQNKKYSKHGYTLNLVAQDPSFDQSQLNRLKDVFFQVYPKLVKDFNKNAVKEITITIDTTYDGVAYAHNGKVVISQDWMKKMPDDIDVVTHEVMHIVQAYPSGNGPGWLVEGVADYVRFKYGVDNAGAKWSLPELKENQHYTNSYRISARFLDWLENNKKKGLVKKLDAAMRNGTYTDSIWTENTQMTLDELWEAYKTAELK